jgi:hypothetical protein
MNSKLPAGSQRRHVDNFIINAVCQQLTDNYIFIDTSWLSLLDPVFKSLDPTKIAVCYSGVDWDNRSCIQERRDAHNIIQNQTKDQIYIGNTNGRYYFNYWAEFIRQNSQYFFDDRYLKMPQITKKFMCLNRKAHIHRKVFVDLLVKNDLFDQGIVSQFTTNVGQLVDTQISKLMLNDGESGSEIPNDIYSLGDPDLWSQHFVNVVTETTTHTNVFLSEKIWKPIIGLRPFVILGDYQIVYKLKELGFDTFDDVFGHWYINPDWQVRANCIIDILKNLPNNLNTMYQQLLPRLEKNRERFINYMDENHKKISNLGLR